MLKEQDKDPEDLANFKAGFYAYLEGGSRSVPVSAIIDLLHREQAFNKTGISLAKKLIKSNHIRAIESQEILALLMDMSKAFVDPASALDVNVFVPAGDIDHGGLPIELPTAHMKTGAHWFARPFTSVRNQAPTPYLINRK